MAQIRACAVKVYWLLLRSNRWNAAAKHGDRRTKNQILKRQDFFSWIEGRFRILAYFNQVLVPWSGFG